ncbi:MAG: response regulator [Syntrophobacteraceae bacterium]|nr:response regulator [Syntrophobacteraceae bacterium]
MPQPIRVLLIDDEEIFVQSLTKVLKRRGMVVESAGSGTLGLELLSRQDFDVVVLDVRMPGMDGLETLKAIRDRGESTPVLILSGHIELGQVSRALREGAAEILLKPCPVDVLTSAIENAYERKVFAEDVEKNGGEPGERNPGPQADRHGTK